MKRMVRIPLFLAAALATTGLATAQVPGAPPPFAGHWEGTANGQRYVEQWTCANGICDGSATSYRGDMETMTETSRIMLFAGQWTYLVKAGEQPPVAFVCTQAHGDTWTFENKAHDFPQRISYTVRGDSLNAYITGPGEKGEMRFDFHLKRVK